MNWFLSFLSIALCIEVIYLRIALREKNRRLLEMMERMSKLDTENNKLFKSFMEEYKKNTELMYRLKKMELPTHGEITAIVGSPNKGSKQ